jgi:hypothetical protein
MVVGEGMNPVAQASPPVEVPFPAPHNKNGATHRAAPLQKTKNLKPRTQNPLSRTRFYFAWLMADSCQGLLPTDRVKVQYSSNFTGSVLLPSVTWPVVSSTL